ncbi:MAG: hypothetical protein OZ921_20325 [Sorangiineae bacterium]|nr:hypothetical protein [Polyangiaceae bacterium]MEB2324871.1 hypothetical protein [Sorangiineae bacterium]
MASARLLFALVPLAGLLELTSHFFFSMRAPTGDDWSKLRGALAAVAKPGDLIVAAPDWADPLARRSFGDAMMPLAAVARPDESAFARAVEVGILGSHAPALDGWRTVSETRAGRFALRVLENPAPARVRYRFLDHVAPDQLTVALGERECAYTESGRPRTGGLFGPATVPSVRHECPGFPGVYAGVTVIDDEEYRPRRCMWATPSAGEPLRLRYRDVPLGEKIYGYTGNSWFLYRDGRSAPVELVVRVGGDALGRAVHQPADGWKRFEFSAGAHAGEREDVEFELRATGSGERQLCFYADSR